MSDQAFDKNGEDLVPTVAHALDIMLRYPGGSYMRCPFCGCKSHTHEETCPIVVVQKELARLSHVAPHSPFDKIGADRMAAIIDEMIYAGHLDARSQLADARLDYGNPFPRSSVATPGEQWAEIAIAMLNELRLDYAPGVLKDTDGVKAIQALRARPSSTRRIPFAPPQECPACGVKFAVASSVTEEMVNRFLSWKLPASVRPDECALDQSYPDRIGTNLLTADEARQMLEHVLTFAPSATRRTDLEWAATWIENTAKHNTDPAVKEFAANMAMTIRAEASRG